MTVTATPQIAIQVRPADPFWVQVRELMLRRAAALGIELIDIEETPAPTGQDELLEQLLVRGAAVYICNISPAQQLLPILEHGIGVIYLLESHFTHPNFTSRVGLDEAGRTLGHFLTERLGDSATILIFGGLSPDETTHDNGQSRLQGFAAALPADGRFAVHHLRAPWEYEPAYATIAAFLRDRPNLTFDAIYALSDPLALAARDAWLTYGHTPELPLIVGVNGDPLALAAVADGSLAATVETDVEDIAVQAVDLAYQAALGAPLPDHLRHRQRLVTAANVTEVATQKLISLADLPTLLVGVNRRNEQQRLRQLETSLRIDRQVGQILDQTELSDAITGLIRDTYGFDRAQLLRWDDATAQLVPFSAVPTDTLLVAAQPDPPDGPLLHALQQGRPVFIPDTAASQRFPPDPRWPALRSRTVIPVHRGGAVVGLLDLHRHQPLHLSREEINGLQQLADQLGVALRNAELYGEAVTARAVAERADRFKTGLLANVSHELRTPLNIILGYSRTALDAIATLPTDTAALGELSADLTQIQRSGQHLQRLVGDLLDLSRAEIGELELLHERLDPRTVLQDLFQSTSASLANNPDVSWRLALPAALPPITADPLRLRQILLNLLHNAQKFTARGSITLGASADVDALRIWVEDTGSGIATDKQEEIFAPFVSGVTDRRRDGVGLGLSIARQLAALHRGQLTVQSTPEVGSRFTLTLPLPVNPPAPPTVAPIAPAPEPPVATRVLVKPLGADALHAAVRELTADAESGTVLIVDDDPATRALYRRLLSEQLPAFQIAEAADGQAALAAVAQQTPSLVILDLIMPELDGFGVLSALRANQQTSGVPVLILSGRTLSAEDLRRLGGGRVVFQSKDILSDEELVTALRRTLDRSAALPAHTSALVKGAMSYIQQRFAEPLSRQQIAEHLGVSKDYLGRLFQQEIGISPWDYLIRYRIMRAKELLATTDSSITEIAALVGFESSAYFSTIFNREVGLAPRAYRAQRSA